MFSMWLYTPCVIVALLTEGVDRNTGFLYVRCEKCVALLTEAWIEIHSGILHIPV